MEEVKITLEKYESLKEQISFLKKEVQRLNEIKEPTKYIRLNFDFKSYNFLFSEWDFKVINEENVEVEFNKIVERIVNKILTKSPQNKFYNKFPRWFHKLLNC